MVVEIDKLVNKLSGLLKRIDFLAENALCLNDREQIFGHSVIITVPRLDIDGVMPYSLARSKYA